MLATILLTVAVLLLLFGVMAAVSSGKGKPRTMRSHGFRSENHNPSTAAGLTSPGSVHRDHGGG